MVRKRALKDSVSEEALLADADPVEITEEEIDEEGEDLEARSRDLTDDEGILDQLKDLYAEVLAGFDAQNDRFDNNDDYWNIYNCKLGPNQFYTGNSAIFVPIVRNAVNARKTRFVNQLFPTSRRHVEAVASDEEGTSAVVSLLEHYIRRCKLRTQVAPPLLRCGDVEGQYSVYVGWQTETRNVTWREDKPVQIEDEKAGVTIDDPDETVEDMEAEEITTGYPYVEVLNDADVLVLPFTADSIPEALESGGSTTVLRRWREGKIKQLIREGIIREEPGERLIKMMTDEESSDSSRRDTSKKQVNAAGIHRDERGYYAIVYETYARLEHEDWGDTPRTCVVYMSGSDPDDVLGVRRNPYWSDRIPVLSAPIEKVAGSFKGKSQIEPVQTLQYQANDACNEGMDSATYALLPIIMTDPEKNPRVGSMILSLAAVWEVDPNSTKFAEFPELWKDALGIVTACKNEIFETLSVNPAKITQQASTKKLTQAEIASEQQIDVLNTADAVTTLEDEIFTPMLSMFLELDHQFRDKEITVRSFGDLGARINMESVPPLQFDRRYTFIWSGVESARNAQMVQQQIGALNVIRTIPPTSYQGYKLNLAPAITNLVQNVFGPQLAPLIFQDVRSQLSMEPALEDELMAQGLDMPIHPLDDHDAHLASHIKELQRLAQERGPDADPKGSFRAHIMKHHAAKAMAAQAQVQAMAPPGAGQPRSAVGGPPRPGASPAASRPVQGPPGNIHQDRMQDPNRMPAAALPPGGVR